MERLEAQHLNVASLFVEHCHRYEIAALVSRGNVVDCACGVGYGAPILLSQKDVNKYVGIDPDSGSVASAKSNFSSDSTSFFQGTLEDNQLKDASVDTFVLIETLEHVRDPINGLRNTARCLSADGLLVGSVPSADYEHACSVVHGENSFHLNIYTQEKLKELLLSTFQDAVILAVEFTTCSILRALTVTEDGTGEQKYGDTLRLPFGLKGGEQSAEVVGSLFFLAGSRSRVAAAVSKLGKLPIYLPGPPKLTIDAQEIVPLRVAFNKAERMIDERDEALRQTPKRRTSSRKSDEPFQAIAFCLAVFTAKLANEVSSQNIDKLFFCSKEGYYLKTLYEYYSHRTGINANTTAIYTLVSRQATYLPSLESFGDNDLRDLTQQYNNISLAELLSSLQMEDLLMSLGQELDLSDQIVNSRYHSDLVLSLARTSGTFRNAFIERRNEQRKNLTLYFQQLAGGTIPRNFYLVDVGWRGSIQNNLHRLFSKQNVIDQSTGFYLGTTKNADTNHKKIKKGILFDLRLKVPTNSHYRECRALFELLLQAPHASIYRYEQANDAGVRPAYITTDDTSNFHPPTELTKLIIERAKLLLDEYQTAWGIHYLEQEAAKRYSKLVFSPTPTESDLFNSWMHAENFGVFENTTFRSPSTTLKQKAEYTLRLIRERKLPDFSFWPYLTIKQRALPGAAWLYKRVRLGDVFSSS